jgi:hypothetical protein
MNNEYYHVNYSQQYAQHCADQKSHKVSVVSLSDAVTHHSTVMVEHLNAILAGRAVTCPIWPKYMASLA